MIAISDYVADHVITRYGVDTDRLRVIPRGVDLDDFDPAKVGEARVDALRRQWELDPQKRIVMLPGRISERKGHTWLLQALGRLWRDGKDSDTICIMVGNRGARGGYAGRVEKMIIDMRLESRVWLTGACADMPAAYALADVVVVPSTGPEAFGRTSIEAQAMGKPVIATTAGACPRPSCPPPPAGWCGPATPITSRTPSISR
ncbi:MAG: glycosyltransferase family 4 protein [Rhizobiales bacterium]|nr:glycosyltransferase family 4 protein [Hyphomicrobiales bacterium]